MPANVAETNGGRRRDGKRDQRTYYIKGVTTATDAILSMLSDNGVPTQIDGYIRDNAQCGAEELEPGRYLGTAVYVNPNTGIAPLPADSFSINFDISGQTTRVRQSLASVARYAPAGKTAPNFYGAINVQDDGAIDGCDVFTPALTYTIRYAFSDGDITTAYINTLSLIVGTVNVADCLGYKAGELLLTRVSGQKRNDGSNLWDITFGFATSRNCANGKQPGGAPFIVRAPKEIGGDITIKEKRGWDYLWVYYFPMTVADDDGITRRYKVPYSAHVEQLYEYTDFTLLGIT